MKWSLRRWLLRQSQLLMEPNRYPAPPLHIEQRVPVYSLLTPPRPFLAQHQGDRLSSDALTEAGVVAFILALIGRELLSWELLAQLRQRTEPQLVAQDMMALRIVLARRQPSSVSSASNLQSGMRSNGEVDTKAD